MNLRFKMLAGFVTLIIIPLLLLGSLVFYITFQLFAQKYSEQAEFSLKAIGQSVSYFFSEMNRVTDTGISNSVFQNALTAGSSENLANANYLQLNENQRNFRLLLYSHPSIGYAFLYNYRSTLPQNQVISIFNKEGFMALPFDQFKKHPLYEQVLKSNGAPKWVGPYEYPEVTGHEPVFTQIRVVKELSSLRNIGILVVQIKNWEIESIFNDFRRNQGEEEDDTRFLLVNNAGMILYDSDKLANGDSLTGMIDSAKLSDTSRYQSFKTSFNGQESIVSMYKLKDYDWHIVSVTSWKMLTKEMISFGMWVAIILLVCVAAAVLFNLLFVNRITHSINRIVRFMRRVESGEMNARVDEKDRDELGALAVGFNRLIDQVCVLLQQVKREQQQKNKAEMRVLEAQIKPHFLFNTLESINVLAVQNEGRKVSQMVIRLGNILRTSIQDKEEITIREELEYTRSYLEIQKFRFEDVFNFEISVPDEIMNAKILKLTLQPLVENCIQHGFDGIMHPGVIRITASEDAECIYLRVKDNGVGMSNKQLSRFQYMQSDECQPSNPELPDSYNAERRGLGVRSVADRVRIRYGPRYGLFICSAPQMGTVIQITIPKFERGERNEREGVAD